MKKIKSQNIQKGMQLVKFPFHVVHNVSIDGNFVSIALLDTEDKSIVDISFMRDAELIILT